MNGKIRKNKKAIIHFDGKTGHKVIKRQLPRGRPVNCFFWVQPREPLGNGNFKSIRHEGCL